MIRVLIAALLLWFTATWSVAVAEIRIPAARLLEFSQATLAKADADEATAEATSYAMLHASLHGVDSHGIRLLPFYVKSLRTGLAKGKPQITVKPQRRAAVLVDAGGGLGHLPTYRAMDEACALARDCGIGMAGIINSTHFGAAGAYALAAANAGFIAMVTCNSGALVVPHGGTRAFHGTSPIAIAAPRDSGDPFLLDMATSSIPWNKVLRYRTEGLPLPEGVAIDASGAFTRDPNQARALAPVGGIDFGYKGAALAGVADVLGGALMGMRLSHEQDGTALGDTRVGHFVVAIDPTTFIAQAFFNERMATYLDAFAKQPGTMPAGGPEWEKRRDREANGIPLPDGLRAELEELARSEGTSLPV
ncbi:MAG: Ldh family oxidoreductase [Hyphomicrobiales bacterium]